MYKYHSHVVHWCGVWVENDPIWFGIYCAGAGVFLAIVLTGGTITYFFPGALTAAGGKIASMIMNIISEYLSFWSGSISLQLLGRLFESGVTHIYRRVLAFIRKLNELADCCKELLDKAEGWWLCPFFDQFGNPMGTVVRFMDAEGNDLCGTVTYLYSWIGDDYIWKCEDGAYYVRILGEWVLMPPDWAPGKPIPGD